VSATPRNRDFNAPYKDLLTAIGIDYSLLGRAAAVPEGSADDDDVQMVGLTTCVLPRKELPAIGSYRVPANEAERTFQTAPGQLLIGVRLFGESLNVFEDGEVLRNWPPVLQYYRKLKELCAADNDLCMYPSGALAGGPHACFEQAADLFIHGRRPATQETWPAHHHCSRG
jgi:hypothetical protein